MSLAALVVGDAVLAGVALGFVADRRPDQVVRPETVVVTTAPSPLSPGDADGAMPAGVVAATNAGPPPASTTTTSAPAPTSSSTTSATTTSSVPADVAETPTTSVPDTTTTTTTTTVAPAPTGPAGPSGGDVSEPHERPATASMNGVAAHA
jgi:hypothetical protein